MPTTPGRRCPRGAPRLGIVGVWLVLFRSGLPGLPPGTRLAEIPRTHDMSEYMMIMMAWHGDADADALLPPSLSFSLHISSLYLSLRPAFERDTHRTFPRQESALAFFAEILRYLSSLHRARQVHAAPCEAAASS